MKKNIALACFTLGFSLFALESEAQIFKLNVTDYGAGAGNATFRSFVDTEIKKIQDEINKDLPSGPPKRMMEGMANSSVMAGKGVGSDYASNMQVVLLGAGLGVGADLEKDSDSKSDLSGIGVAPGMIVGGNLGAFGAKNIFGIDGNRLNLYLNFMKYGLDRTLSNKPGKESKASVDMLAMGIHLRYDLIQRKPARLFGFNWGGVKLHMGYEYNKTELKLNSNISETVSSTSGSETISGTVTGSPVAKILVNTHSIPIELSTDVQLLYILSLYTGVGADYSFGQAKGESTLNAGNSPITCTGGACGGGGSTVQVRPEANIDATGKASPFLFRGFAGVQFNLPYLRIFGQIDKAVGNQLIGATAGVRFVY